MIKNFGRYKFLFQDAKWARWQLTFDMAGSTMTVAILRKNITRDAVIVAFVKLIARMGYNGGCLAQDNDGEWFIYMTGPTLLKVGSWNNGAECYPICTTVLLDNNIVYRLDNDAS